MLQPRQPVPEAPDLLHLVVAAALHTAPDVLLQVGQQPGVQLLQGPVAAVSHRLQTVVTRLQSDDDHLF